MADFNVAYKLILKHEGGYANLANDAGGETYRGVAKNYHPEPKRIWEIIDSYKKNYPGGAIPNNTVFNNPELDGLIKNVYKQEFWDKIGGDSITDQDVANILVDAYVGQTKGFGYMWSNALNKSGLNNYQYYSSPKMSVSFNGFVPDTNSVDQKTFFNNFKDERESYFRYRASMPGQEGFLSGWLNRLQSFAYTGFEKAVAFTKQNWVAIAIVGTLLVAGITALILYRKNIIKAAG